MTFVEIFACLLAVALLVLGLYAWWSLRHEADPETLAERDRVAAEWQANEGRAPGDLGGDQ
jgi:uncharacterized iron-regulated membrane protein